MKVYSGYEDIPNEGLEAVEISTCAEMDDKDVRILGQGITHLIHQFTETRQFLRYFSDPPAETYPSDTCLVIQGAPAALVEPIVLRSLSYPFPEGEHLGEELIDNIGDGFLVWLEFNDAILRDAGITTSNHRVDMGSIRLGKDEKGWTFFEVTVYPPIGGIVPAPVEPVIPDVPLEPVPADELVDLAYTAPEKKRIWPYIVAGGVAIGGVALLGWGVYLLATTKRTR